MMMVYLLIGLFSFMFICLLILFVEKKISEDLRKISEKQDLLFSEIQFLINMAVLEESGKIR